MLKEIQILIGNGRIGISVSPNVKIEQVRNAPKDTPQEILDVAAELIRRGPCVHIYPYPRLTTVQTDVEICQHLKKMLGI